MEFSKVPGISPASSGYWSAAGNTPKSRTNSLSLVEEQELFGKNPFHEVYKDGEVWSEGGCQGQLPLASGTSVEEFDNWRKICSVAKELAKFLLETEGHVISQTGVMINRQGRSYPRCSPAMPYNILTQEISHYSYATATPTDNFASGQQNVGGSYAQIREELSPVLENGWQIGDRVVRRSSRAEMRRANRRKGSDHCVFCYNNACYKRNNENDKRKGQGLPPLPELQKTDEGVWRDHTCKDLDGGVICPVLFRCKCKHCGATGRSAHTDRYCPFKEPVGPFKLSVEVSK